MERIYQCDGRRQDRIVLYLVVVTNDRVHSDRFCPRNFFSIRRSCIDTYQKRKSALTSFCQRPKIDAAVLGETIGDVIIGLDAQKRERLPQKHGSRSSIYIQIAPNEDLFVIRDGLFDTFDGLCHAVHEQRFV